ncbi:MAG: DMT family transporter [Hyphomicrobiaceae bacterium]
MESPREARPLPSRQTVPAHQPGLAMVMMLLAMFLFASMDALSKVAARELPIPQILWVRYILFTMFVAIMLRRQGLRAALVSGQPWVQAIRSVLIIFENGLFVLAFVYMPLADVHAIAAVSPLIVIALSRPLLGETVGIRRWLAVMAGFIGVLVIVRPGFVRIDWPILIPLAAAFLWGLYQVMVRMCARTDTGETTWAWSAVVGLLVTTLVGPFVWVWPDARGWLLLVAIGMIGSAAHFTLIKALEFWEAGALQPFSYTLLVWATVIGFFAFGHIPDGWTMTGALVIILSGLYAWQRERALARRPVKQETP